MPTIHQWILQHQLLQTKYVIYWLEFIIYERIYFKTNIATAPMPSTPTYPCLAVVLYDFEGANEQEISVRKDEKIFIESKPDYDGWLVAKARDRTGLVPEAYVQLLSANATPLLEQGLSFILSSSLLHLKTI